MRTETFIALLSGCYWLTLFLTIALILIVSVKRYWTYPKKKRAVMAMIGTLAIWLVLSLGVLIVLGLYSWAAIHTIDDNPPIRFELATGSVVGAIALHMLAGGGLIYWTERRSR